jgi:hypothetical protein
MEQALGYLIKSKKGLVLTETSYPYTSGTTRETGCCRAPFDQKLAAGVSYGARVTNYTYVAQDEVSDSTN